MKYLLSLLLTFFTSCLLAQNPTYEETVDFIKVNCVGRMLYEGALDSYQRETGHKLTKVEIQKDGRIKLYADQQYGKHDFEIVFNIFDLKSSIDYPDGIRAYKFLVHFQGLNVSSGYGITFATDADAQRVARAFRHLKTMCSKGGGLFDAPTQTEKPILTKTETLEYIENLINKQLEFSYQVYWDNASDYADENLYQKFSANTGSFNSSVSWAGCQDKRWCSYSEHESYYRNISNSINRISLLAPDSEQKSFQKKFYCVKIEYTSPIQGNLKKRYNILDIDASDGHTLSEAENSCRSQSWIHEDLTRSTLEIFVKDETDSKRLKKAFEHLAALIQEEQNSKKESDPFGN